MKCQKCNRDQELSSNRCANVEQCLAYTALARLKLQAQASERYPLLSLKQSRAIPAIANERGVRAENITQELFGIEPTELSGYVAGYFIAYLKTLPFRRLEIKRAEPVESALVH